MVNYFWLDGVIGELNLFLTSGRYFMDPDWLGRSGIFAIDDSIIGLDSILRKDVDFLFLFEGVFVDGVNFFQGTWMVLFISDHFYAPFKYYLMKKVRNKNKASFWFFRLGGCRDFHY